jgi:hypothetical protein
VQSRFSQVVLGALALIALATIPRRAPTFTPFVPHPLPQRAQGDFDGDGRSDVALVQDRADSGRLSVRLSGSPNTIDLEATVTGVIEGDVDQDGDLDLVALSPSSDVLVWINDGHGHFTRQQTPRAPGLCDEPVIGDTVLICPLGMTAPGVACRDRADTGLVVTHIRPPTSPESFDFALFLLPSLRAPPPPFPLISFRVI